MPVFQVNGKTILFIHIPKSGGTTVERVLCKNDFQMSYFDGGGEQSLNQVRRCSPQHMHYSLLRENFALDKFDYIFSVTREPLARFKSEYCMRNLKGGLPTTTVADKWALGILARYKINPFALDNHIRPQAEFIGKKVDVFKLEDGLSSVFRKLEKVLDCEIEYDDSRHLESKKKLGFSSREVAFSSPVAAIIKTFYKKDYKALGYC